MELSLSPDLLIVAAALFTRPLHAYTQELIASIPGCAWLAPIEALQGE